MRKHIETYYRTERISSAFLSIMGGLSSTIGIAYYFFKTSPFSFGLMSVLCMFGTYQSIVGLVRLYRSRLRFKLALEDDISNTGHLRNKEYPRLQKKEQIIKKMRYLELGVLISCILILALFLVIPYTQSVLGTLIGLTFHSSFLMMFDLFSQFRLQEYIHQLEKYLRG